MTNKLESLIYVRWPKGYVAHVRFEDRKDDIDISSASKYFLEKLVNSHIKKAIGPEEFNRVHREFDRQWSRR